MYDFTIQQMYTFLFTKFQFHFYCSHVLKHNYFNTAVSFYPLDLICHWSTANRKLTRKAGKATGKVVICNQRPLTWTGVSCTNMVYYNGITDKKRSDALNVRVSRYSYRCLSKDLCLNYAATDASISSREERWRTQLPSSSVNVINGTK